MQNISDWWFLVMLPFELASEWHFSRSVRLLSDYPFPLVRQAYLHGAESSNVQARAHQIPFSETRSSFRTRKRRKSSTSLIQSCGASDIHFCSLYVACSLGVDGLLLHACCGGRLQEEEAGSNTETPPTRPDRAEVAQCRSSCVADFLGRLMTRHIREDVQCVAPGVWGYPG